MYQWYHVLFVQPVTTPKPIPLPGPDSVMQADQPRVSLMSRILKLLPVIGKLVKLYFLRSQERSHKYLPEKFLESIFISQR